MNKLIGKEAALAGFVSCGGGDHDAIYARRAVDGAILNPSAWVTKTWMAAVSVNGNGGTLTISNALNVSGVSRVTAVSGPSPNLRISLTSIPPGITSHSTFAFVAPNRFGVGYTYDLRAVVVLDLGTTVDLNLIDNSTNTVIDPNVGTWAANFICFFTGVTGLPF